MSALRRITVNGIPSEYPKIVVSATNSTLPYRGMDYCAHYDGEEEAGNYGWGRTRDEAIRDFIENCRDDHNERLGLDEPPLAILAHPTFRQMLIVIAILLFALVGILGVEALNAAEGVYQAGIV